MNASCFDESPSIETRKLNQTGSRLLRWLWRSHQIIEDTDKAAAILSEISLGNALGYLSL